ncbi:hypothetical protein [Brevibacillus daliensis]|uniref:hypothetical protein n=1 Tax=Brevibacillus daliensis TaxID=2892995 RepID=UPI001E62B026|nr:hypothetical protein [Brevibacillus daliensis]
MQLIYNKLLKEMPRIFQYGHKTNNTGDNGSGYKERDVMRSTWVSVLLIGIIFTFIDRYSGYHTYENTGDFITRKKINNSGLKLTQRQVV